MNVTILYCFTCHFHSRFDWNDLWQKCVEWTLYSNELGLSERLFLRSHFHNANMFFKLRWQCFEEKSGNKRFDVEIEKQLKKASTVLWYAFKQISFWHLVRTCFGWYIDLIGISKYYDSRKQRHFAAAKTVDKLIRSFIKLENFLELLWSGSPLNKS